MKISELDAAEWGNTDQIYVRFGLRKGTLLKLAQAGRIKSVSIRINPTAKKSVRLFSITSIKELIRESLETTHIV